MGKGFIISTYLAVMALLVPMALPGVLVARAESPPDPGGTPIVREETLSGEQIPDTMDEKQQEWSEVIVSTATWMDDFFDEDLYQSTSNKTYLRLKAGPFLNHRGLTLKTSTDLRLRLPNTERWLFNIGGSPDADNDPASSLEEEERADSGRDESNAYVGVNTFFKQTRNRNIGTGGGVKLSSDRLALYGTFSWVELWPFKNWDLRATQRLRVYTDVGPEFKTQIDTDWPIAHQFLFRTTASALFKKDDPNNFYDFNLTLFQYLTTRRALMYKVRNGFRSSGNQSFHLNKVITEVEYRRQWRDWFYTSLIPQVSLQKNRDWRADPGIRLDFSVRLGYVEKTEYQSPYVRKQQSNAEQNAADRDRALQEGFERLQQHLKKGEEAGE